MYCRNCGQQLKNKDTCISCGFTKGSGNTYCFNCGHKLPFSEIIYCQHCKTLLKKIEKPIIHQPTKSRLISGFLQVFFGCIGLGRFYMNSYLIAVLQIIVSFLTLGIGSIWGFIDGILILSKKINKDGNGCTLKD